MVGESCFITVPEDRGEDVVRRIKEKKGKAKLLSPQEKEKYSAEVHIVPPGYDVVEAQLPPGLLAHEAFGEALK